MLAHRLARVMSKLISPNQTAFLAGRQILDGVLIANEIVRYAKKEKINLLLFKVDFVKAFDSVNWRFLEDIMIQMGFGYKWYLYRFWLMDLHLRNSKWKEVLDKVILFPHSCSS